jgi:hypothetical protein
MKMLLPMGGRLTFPHEYTIICEDSGCVPMGDESEWVADEEEFYTRKSGAEVPNAGNVNEPAQGR